MDRKEVMEIPVTNIKKKVIKISFDSITNAFTLTFQMCFNKVEYSEKISIKKMMIILLSPLADINISEKITICQNSDYIGFNLSYEKELSTIRKDVIKWNDVLILKYVLYQIFNKNIIINDDKIAILYSGENISISTEIKNGACYLLVALGPFNSMNVKEYYRFLIWETDMNKLINNGEMILYSRNNKYSMLISETESSEYIITFGTFKDPIK